MQTLREAVVAILAADAGVTALVGTRIVERSTTGPAPATPCLAYAVRDLDDGTGQATVLLSGIADNGGDSLGDASAIAAAGAAALTAAALTGASLSGVPFASRAIDVDEAGDVREGRFSEGSPNLRQADEVVPLLLFTD